MITPLLVLALYVAPVAVCDVSAPPLRPETPAARTQADSSLGALYESGDAFSVFLDKAVARRAMWLKHWEASEIPADVLVSAQAIPGRWRILVSAVDGCSDSVNTVPYLARLVALVPSLELRIVQPGPGRVIMEAHRTPDGRPATPTVVILDADGNDVGCWVERPAVLQEMALAARAAGTIDDFQRNKQQWYDADAGASTLREVVSVISAAATGSPLCLQGSAPLPSAATGR